jgi:beta-N-acetylhexosaminidase
VKIGRAVAATLLVSTLAGSGAPTASATLPGLTSSDSAADADLTRTRASGEIGDLISKMSLREKIGQLVMFSISGKSLTSAERDAIADGHLGGVILFARNYEDKDQLASLTEQIQAAVRPASGVRAGALISVDQEGGVVKRFEDMPPRYSAPRMGEIGSKTVAFEEGKKTGYALKQAGVNVNLAPVADLDLPPEHVMAARSFGANRYAAGRLAKAFGEGMQGKRVAATAKHFPGLGGATQNTDNGRAYVYRSKHDLRTIDAVPFEKAIRAGFQLMMVSHAMFVNDGGEIPASMSYHISTRRLREGFGFEGVAISDDLGAVAWRFGGSVARACKNTVKAGVDIALLAGDHAIAQACASKLYKAVRRDSISQHRIDQAVGRVLRLKRWLRLLPG